MEPKDGDGQEDPRQQQVHEMMEQIAKTHGMSISTKVPVNGWPSTAIDITDLNFSDFVQRYKIVIVEFWAHFCPTCRAMAPVIEGAARDFRGRIAVGKMNIESNKIVPQQFTIMSVPSLILFKDGEPAERITGGQTGSQLKAFLARHVE